MTGPPQGARLDEASSELGLAGSFLEPSAPRLAALAAAARAPIDAERLLAHLESHGLLCLFQRNLALAGVRLAADAEARLAERARVLRLDAQRFRFTLERFLAEAEARGVTPILLKGASLGLDVYTDPGLRSQGDVDLLVAPGELAAVRVAAGAAGLVESEEAFPGWWYRLAHFHRKLAPGTAFLREIEVHWALHHPSLLYRVRDASLHARAQEARSGTRTVRTLEPLDRFLHLVTHLASHARGALGPPERATLRGVLADLAAPLRLKWIVDVHAEWERRGEAWGWPALLARAREWNAEAPLAATLALVRRGFGLAPAAERAAEELLRALGDVPEVDVSAPIRGELVPGLDLRPAALARAPRWAFPPRRFFAGRRGAGSAPGLAALRALHAGAVLGRLGAGLVAFPFALAGRALLRPRRRRALALASAPERILDLTVAWRRFVAEEERAAAPVELGRYS